MACVAVTRGGLGEAWLFADQKSADEHPIVQFGDAIVCCSADVGVVWSEKEFPALADIIGDERLKSSLETGVLCGDAALSRIWDRLQVLARQLPEDPGDIVSVIVRDRRLTRVSGISYRCNTKERTMSDTTEKRPVSRKARFNSDAVITMGNDDEGVPYGPENNPKRSGSEAHERFKLYQPGLTVQETIDAGVRRADINWDAKQGFIVIN